MKFFSKDTKKSDPFVHNNDTRTQGSNAGSARSEQDLQYEYIRETFASFQDKPSKYRFLNKQKKNRILWPFIVIFPILLISIILNAMDTDQPTNEAALNTTEADTQIEGESNKTSEEYNYSMLAKEVAAIFDAVPNPIPEDIRRIILINIAIFSKDLLHVLDSTSPELLWLVDKQHAISENYVPLDLISLNDYKPPLSLSKNSMQLRSILVEDLLAMDAAARQEQITLVISSCYRSYAYQNTIFNSISKAVGLEEAQRQSARPGTSQHQLGTALDFGSIDESFGYTEAGKWLRQKAWLYGFSLSYPEDHEPITGYMYESWHFRYIGKVAALFEQSHFNGIQQYMLEFIHYIPEDSILRKAH